MTTDRLDRATAALVEWCEELAASTSGVVLNPFGVEEDEPVIEDLAHFRRLWREYDAARVEHLARAALAKCRAAGGR